MPEVVEELSAMLDAEDNKAVTARRERNVLDVLRVASIRCLVFLTIFQIPEWFIFSDPVGSVLSNRQGKASG